MSYATVRLFPGIHWFPISFKFVLVGFGRLSLEHKIFLNGYQFK